MNFLVLSHLLLTVAELRAQIVPSDFLYFDGEIGPVNGSSRNGNCFDTSSEFFDDRGLLLTCEAPATSVLFDGSIPTLSQLDGDMWASQLLTARNDRATIPSAQLFIDFFNQLGGVGAERVELVIFNCPEWNITVQTINIEDVIAGEVIGSLNLTLSSCESLVKVCIPVTNLFQPRASILLTFPDEDNSRWIHLAEVTFYNSVGNNCVPETLLEPAGSGGSLPNTGTTAGEVSAVDITTDADAAGDQTMTTADAATAAGDQTMTTADAATAAGDQTMTTEDAATAAGDQTVTTAEATTAGMSTAEATTNVATTTDDIGEGGDSVIVGATVASVGGVAIALILGISCTIIVHVTLKRHKSIPEEIYENVDVLESSTKIATGVNECYISSISVEGNVSYGTTKSKEKTATHFPTHRQQQDTEDQEYAVVAAIPISANQCYDKTSPPVDAAIVNEAYVAVDPDAATPRIHADINLTQNNAYATSNEIQVESNQCYDTTIVSRVDSGVALAQKEADVTSIEDISVESNQCYATTDVDLTQNDAYVASPKIQVEYNQCYGTKKADIDPNPSYSEQPEGEDDYVIP